METNDPLARIDELRLLRAGWLDGHGQVPSPAEFDWLETFFTQSYPSSLPAPYVFPTEDGGIQLEWRTGNQDMSLEINLSDKSGEVHTFNTETYEEIYEELSLVDQEDIDRLIDLVSKAARGEI
ncbi:hypothetical protein D9M70_501670 [compost metagenome]